MKLYYKGKRLNGEKLFQVFTNGKSDRLFKGIRGVYIGFCYEAKKDNIQITPKQIGEERHKDCGKWDIEEEVDKEKYRKIQAYKKLDRKEYIIEDLSPLKELVEDLSHNDIEYFSRWLARKLFNLKIKVKK